MSGGQLCFPFVLLVLDNFEHLLDAAATVAELLDACRELHVLVTSRIPLHLVREHEYSVPPLSLPDPRRLPPAEILGRYEAVALFIDRTQAVQSDFAITEDNALAVVEICARLDDSVRSVFRPGLPPRSSSWQGYDVSWSREEHRVWQPGRQHP